MTYISIIIPTFNKSPLVCDIVRKLKEQTFKDFEVIVVDDGSSDDTIVNLRNMRRRERHLKVKVYTTGLHDKFGMCQAINAGLREARGRLSFFLNDDIYLHPQCLEEHARAQIETGYKFAFLGPRFRCPPHEVGNLVVDRDSRRYCMRKYTIGNDKKYGYSVYRKRMMVSSNLSISTQKMCNIGGYNEYFERFTGAIDRDVYHRLGVARIPVLYLFEAQAYSVEYGYPLYQQTKWVQDKSLHGDVSIPDWKREQMRYSEKMEMKAKENPPKRIERRVK